MLDDVPREAAPDRVTRETGVGWMSKSPSGLAGSAEIVADGGEPGGVSRVR